MAWTYAQLKAAVAALSPPPASMTAAAAALAAQTTTQAVDVPVAAVVGYLLLNQLDIAGWVAGNSASSAVGAGKALLGLTTSPHVDTIEMSKPATTSAVQAMLNALVSVGFMTASQQSGLLAMASMTVPAWQPAPTVGDIQTAEGAL